MVTFRNKNNQRRNNFRRNERSFKSNGERTKFGSNFTNNENFQRKIPGRNNHNAPKLIEKYNNLAKKLYQVETRYYLRNILKMLNILKEIFMIKKILKNRISRMILLQIFQHQQVKKKNQRILQKMKIRKKVKLR